MVTPRQSLASSVWCVSYACIHFLWAEMKFLQAQIFANWFLHAKICVSQQFPTIHSFPHCLYTTWLFVHSIIIMQDTIVVIDYVCCEILIFSKVRYFISISYHTHLMSSLQLMRSQHSVSFYACPILMRGDKLCPSGLWIGSNHIGEVLQHPCNFPHMTLKPWSVRIIPSSTSWMFGCKEPTWNTTHGPWLGELS